MNIRKVGDDSFVMSGTIDLDFQLIFEALEMAATSGDQFAPAFAALSEKLALQSEDWR